MENGTGTTQSNDYKESKPTPAPTKKLNRNLKSLNKKGILFFFLFSNSNNKIQKHFFTLKRKINFFKKKKKEWIVLGFYGLFLSSNNATIAIAIMMTTADPMVYNSYGVCAI